MKFKSMKNKVKNLITVLVISLPALFMYACEKDFSEQDSDLLAGKWRDSAVLNNGNLKEEDYMAYVEYAPYDYLYANRKINYVYFLIDTTLDDPILRFERKGHYTLKGDTLEVQDSMDRRIIYTVQYIRNDTLCYKDRKDSTYIYIRYHN